MKSVHSQQMKGLDDGGIGLEKLAIFVIVCNALHHVKAFPPL